VGDIYLDTYNGWYNIKEETFITENEAQLTDYKDPASGQVRTHTHLGLAFFLALFLAPSPSLSDFHH